MTLPTKPEQVELFEKTLICDFCCVSIRLALDSTILFLKNEKFTLKDSLKLIYKVRSGKDNVLEVKSIVRKILKMDENNQYANVMTKPLPTDSITKLKRPSLKKSNLINESLSAEVSIGHHFAVDTKFNDRKTN